MWNDHTAVAGILAGEFAIAPPVEKGRIWCMTLSIGDAFAKSDPNFNRSEFYAIVFGTPDHFAARDKFTRTWVNA